LQERGADSLHVQITLHPTLSNTRTLKKNPIGEPFRLREGKTSLGFLRGNFRKKHRQTRTKTTGILLLREESKILEQNKALKKCFFPLYEFPQRTGGKGQTSAKRY